MLSYYDNRNANKFHLDNLGPNRSAKIKASDNGVVEVLTISFAHMALGNVQFLWNMTWSLKSNCKYLLTQQLHIWTCFLCTGASQSLYC